MMNKKILAVLSLLLIVVSVTVSYRVLNQPVAKNNQSTGSSGTITQDDMAGEINNIFINETQEIEIGEMV